MWNPRRAQGNALFAWITFASGAGFTLFGYDQGVFGAFLGNENFIKTFNNPNSTLQGHITATYDLGCFLGAIVTMWLGNKWGSRKIIMTGCAILIIGAILQAASYHVAQLIIGRFVAGLGNGMNTAAIPVWQSETTPALHRGRIMVLQLALNQVGNVTAQWLNYGMTFISTNSVAWRFPTAFQIFLALITMATIPALPDSPRWLCLVGRNQEALEIVNRLHVAGTPREEVQRKFDLIRTSLEHEMEMGKITVKTLLGRDKLHTTRRILLGAGTQFMQQFGGINVIVYYLPVVFASLGISRNLSLILSSCNAMNLLFSTCVGILYVETFGRKKMMVYGAAVQSLCFALVAAGLGAGGRKWECVAVAFVFAYITTFGLSWIAVPWMYPAEINSQRTRFAGAGIATATNWICNYVVVLITPIGISNIGWRYYLVYAVLNAVFVPVVQYFYVETARMTLEEVDNFFEQSQHRRLATSSPSSNDMTISDKDEAVHVDVAEKA